MKRALGDLAAFGGAPAFDQVLHVGRPNIGDRAAFAARIDDIFDRRWLTNDGPLVREFERRVQDYTGVRHCVAMCNGTVALEIAVRATGLSGEVIVPALTFVATAHALQWQQIRPVFCDVDPVTHTLDPARVEALITPRTSAVLGVHLWGQPCQVEALREIAERHRVTLLFDAAHAFGCSQNGIMVGNFGTAEVFSFHATKFVNSFEGGAVVTNDATLADRLRLMRNFGFSGYDEVSDIGTNGKMSEMAAAMGLTSLDAIDGFLETNRRNFLAYQSDLAGIPGIHLHEYPRLAKVNFQYVVLEVTPQAKISRDRLLDLLWAENVRARRYFYPGVHRMQPYRSLYPELPGTLPETERLASRLLVLPTGEAIGPEAIVTIAQLIRFIVEHGDEVEQRAERRDSM